uniref:Lipocalin n=1 Tax=Rhipicephalus appendiculatus TaxID=34631 RepID=A0A131YP43_RHIAP
MDEKRLFATLLFAVCVARLECKLPLIGKDWDIREFLKTPEPIWTYATSQATAIICKEDIKKAEFQVGGRICSPSKRTHDHNLQRFREDVRSANQEFHH